MRSFHLLSLLSSVFLLSRSHSQAQHLYRHETPHARHRRHDSDTYKRDVNAVFTYFNDGQGSCGADNGPNDFIVALNSAQYDNGAHCFEMITITVDGKATQAQITDECPGCGVGDLDLSPGLFQYFAPLSEGELHGSWDYNSDIPTPSSISPAPAESYSSTTAVATVTSPSLASPTTATSSLIPTVVPSSTLPTSTIPTSTPQDPQFIAQINLALLELGTLLHVSLSL